MSNTKNLANLAAALDDGTSGQVLQSTGSGGVQFTDSSGSGVTVHANQAAMLTDAASADEGTLHYETGTNKLYVKQTSGFYLLASITNASPTIDSFSENTGGAGANNLTAGGTFTLTSGSNTVVTINATEPDLETISYSATVTSGTATDVFSSPSFPVTNQSSNVFTLTPLTSGTGGTVTIRFDASDGTNVANVSHSFEIAFVIADSHYTSLLMATDGSAGDNNDITDSSSNNHTITVTGDAYAGTFSPYRHGGYSVYFDGSGDSLNTTATQVVPTTSFTVSAWVYLNDTTNGAVWGQGTSGNSGRTGVSIDNGNWFAQIGNNPFGTLPSVSAGQWYYTELQWDGSTLEFFVDGTSLGSASVSTSPQNSAFYIGDLGSAWTTAYPLNGYVADLRVVSGTPSGSSTVPTERLTAITNTKLLTCHLPYISDGSSSGHSITVNGDPETKPFGPYDYNEYSATDNGGSIEFDGSGDYVSPPGHADFAFSTNDFTIEFFVYIRTHKDYTELWDARTTSQGSTTASPIIYSDSNGDIHFFHSNSNRITGSFKKNQWTHVALCRASSQTKLFINGSQAGSTYSDTTDYVQPASNWSIGASLASNNYFLDGSMSEIRAVNGTAVYSGNFTPPTGPLTTTGGTYSDTTNVNTSITASHTKLLLKCTDAHVIDKSQGNNLKLVGTAASTSALTSGSTPPYIGAAWANTSAVSFDGDSDYVQLPVGSLDLGSSDFTIEAWIYQDTNAGSGGSSHTIYSDWLNTNNDKSSILRVTDSSGQKVQFLYSTDGSANTIYTSTATISNSTWTHVAVCKDSTSLRFYKDGAREVWASSPSFTLNSNSGAVGPIIGATFEAQGGNFYQTYFDGYIQDLRVTKGKARYTAADESSNIPSTPLKG